LPGWYYRGTSISPARTGYGGGALQPLSAAGVISRVSPVAYERWDSWWTLRWKKRFWLSPAIYERSYAAADERICAVIYRGAGGWRVSA